MSDHADTIRRPTETEERRALGWLMDRRDWTEHSSLERHYAASLIDTLAWFEQEHNALLAERQQAIDALRLIDEGRCECGGEFKQETTGQVRCEKCDRHKGYGYGMAQEIARAALAKLGEEP